MLCGILQRRAKASKFGYYTQDVRVGYPPKSRSKVWRLPVHRKLGFVTNGHVNDYSKRNDSKEAPRAEPVTAVVFAKSNSHKLLHNFTRSEFEFVFAKISDIRAFFDAQAALLSAQSRADRGTAHSCRCTCLLKFPCLSGERRRGCWRAWRCWRLRRCGRAEISCELCWGFAWCFTLRSEISSRSRFPEPRLAAVAALSTSVRGLRSSCATRCSADTSPRLAMIDLLD